MPLEDDNVSNKDSDNNYGILPKDTNHLSKGIISQLSEL